MPLQEVFKFRSFFFQQTPPSNLPILLCFRFPFSGVDAFSLTSPCQSKVEETVEGSIRRSAESWAELFKTGLR